MTETEIWKLAVDVSKQSNCSKRNVGCVITTENGAIVSTGFNYHADGICDCNTTKTAIHAEVDAINSIPESMRETDLYSYTTHKHCSRCQSLLNSICKQNYIKELSPVLNNTTVEEVLKERKSTHGDFSESSRYVQYTKVLMSNTPNWEELPPKGKESLHMIQHKIGRILYGDYNHKDSWIDIAGYANLGVKNNDTD